MTCRESILAAAHESPAVLCVFEALVAGTHDIRERCQLKRKEWVQDHLPLRHAPLVGPRGTRLPSLYFAVLARDRSRHPAQERPSVRMARSRISGAHAQGATRRVRFLARPEALALFRELPTHLADLAAFSLATGLRRANVTGLQWTQSI
jgi:hypothetical protein